MKNRILFLIVLLVFTSNFPCFAVSIDRFLFVNDVAFEPSGERYWIGTNDAIYQLDAETHDILQNIEIAGPVKLLVVSPDGQRIIAGGELVDSVSSSFYELRSIDGELIKTVTGHFKMSRPVFPQTGSKFFVIDRYENKVQIYDCQLGQFVMKTDIHDQTIISAAIQTYGSENQFELLLVYAISSDDDFNYQYLYTWDVDDNILRSVSGRFSQSSIFVSYSNQCLSIDGTYLSSICIDRGGQIDISYWSIYYTRYLNYWMGHELGVWGSSISNFSDDESYFWAINQGLGHISVLELDSEHNVFERSSEYGKYELIADLCTIDNKPVMITVFIPKNDYNKSNFVIIDIETGQHISESPPITEMFQGSTIQSWMLHE